MNYNQIKRDVRLEVVPTLCALINIVHEKIITGQLPLTGRTKRTNFPRQSGRLGTTFQTCIINLVVAGLPLQQIRSGRLHLPTL